MADPLRPEPLVLRAARYFGYHDTPRQSIKLNNTDCLIVADGHSGRTILMHYSEEFRPTGTFVKLTPRAMGELLQALEAHHVAA